MLYRSQTKNRFCFSYAEKEKNEVQLKQLRTIARIMISSTIL